MKRPENGEGGGGGGLWGLGQCRWGSGGFTPPEARDNSRYEE